MSPRSLVYCNVLAKPNVQDMSTSMFYSWQFFVFFIFLLKTLPFFFGDGLVDSLKVEMFASFRTLPLENKSFKEAI